MRLVILVENVVYGKLTAEHGLSIYIEHEGERILFDTGQSDRFLKNAQMLGIDIASVDTVVLSHGHYDHAGGLEHFCRVNSKARIYAKRGFFDKKFNKDGRFIGIPYNAELYRQRLSLLDTDAEIAPGMRIITDIPLANSWDTHFENLFVRAQTPEATLCGDTFEDEQFLAIETDAGLAVLSGCSHRGITNILEAASAASAMSEQARFHLVLGGFHLSNADDALAERVVQRLAATNIDRLGCCHCTGVDNYARVKARIGPRAFYAWTGTDTRD